MVFIYALAISLAGLFGWSLNHKLRSFDVFRQSLEDYRLAPKGASTALSMTIILAEVACLVALAFATAYGLLVSAAILLLYAGAMAANLMRGRRHIDCGCYAPGAKRSTISWTMVWRNAVVAVLALAASGAATIAPPVVAWLDIVSVAGCAAALVLLYNIFEATHLQGNT